jgi:hypothetical protein
MPMVENVDKHESNLGQIQAAKKFAGRNFTTGPKTETRQGLVPTNEF